MNGFLKRRLLARLDNLRGGRVVLREGASVDTLGSADGPDPLEAGVTVRDPRFYRMLALGGSLGAAEAWLRGWWDADDLTALLRVFARDRDLTAEMEGGAARLLAPFRRLAHRLRRNTRRGSRRNIEEHYDLGNDFFSLFLDETLTYSAGIFEQPGANLREASVAKLDRICRKLDLSPSDHVLEIGTGWGSFALHAAGEYGARVTTTTISAEQRALAVERVRRAGLEDRVRVLGADYRDLEGRYDRLVSIEMIEAVGHEFLGRYFAKCSALLAVDGAMALQAIVMPDRGYDRYLRSVDFIRTHVFPGGCLPSVGSMTDAVARETDLRVVGHEDLTPHYATTLRHWRERFLANLDRVRALGHSERFLRLWEFYLSYCEAGFRERAIGDVQLMLAKPGRRELPVLPPLPRHEEILAT